MATQPFVGRKEEVQLLNSALSSNESEMIAMVGRRRVGKTCMIRSVCGKRLCFDLTGLQNATLEEQLSIFRDKLTEYTASPLPLAQPASWLEAFKHLRSYLETLPKKRERIVFFDEVPWIDTHKSGFLNALTHFWNDWAVQANVKLILCGSAASWMLDKVVNNKGGLHNRISRLLTLQPFTLAETEEFLQSRGIKLERYQIIQLYMVVGGIPHYLKELRKGESPAQMVDRTFFSKSGLLQNEFSNLYAALFDRHETHVAVIKALATKWRGLTRKELVAIGKLPDGGGLSNTLDELEQSSFITSYQPFGRKVRTTLYRLTDEFSLFYLRFVEGSKSRSAGSWMQLSTGRKWNSWTGYAFENVCLNHVDNIKKALGISGVYTEQSSFISRGGKDTQGIQIDMLIDRADQIITLCEMKFHSAEFTVSKAYAEQLRKRKELFRQQSGTKKQLTIALCTPFGLQSNSHSLATIDHVVAADPLFV